jgi:uncharacterized protein with NAD-binding domain and iron-sulfur cluster
VAGADLMPKQRVVILGGGVGGVTAAVQLSQPGWEQHFESITLYQQGWRLGGKGASGRGKDERIEEHGLHIWFGFYENAFRMLRRCHAELDERARRGDPRWPLAFTKMEDSFRPVNEICLTDHDGCCWKLWVADFFDDDDDLPWAEPDLRASEGRPENWSVLFYLVRCLRLAADLAWSLTRSEQRLEIVPSPVSATRAELAGPDDFVSMPWSWLTAGIQEALDGAAEMLDSVTEEMLDQPIVDDVFELMIRALDRVLDFLRQRYDELVRSSDAARRAWYVVDLLVAIARGIFEDDLHSADSFDVIDDYDFREWLLAHGADRDTVDCALVRTVVYDLAFGYEDGNPERPACGAGTALRGLLRTFFTYRGSLMWKMNAGMGDVVFAPLYELLVKRGVKVRFFHRVEAVHAADGVVKRIDIDVQAAVPPHFDRSDYLRPGREEDEEHGPPPWKAVWPASPSQLPNGREWAPLPAAFYESWYRGREPALVGETKLDSDEPGADGFDLVVFALPISCVPHVAPDLVSQSDLLKAAVERLHTVPTQAMQLWLNRPASKLGALPGIVLGGFVEPYDTWADMPHLVDQEKVAGSQTVAYFCNVLTHMPPPVRGDADDWLDLQDALVRDHAVRFIDRDLGKLWPEAVDRQSRKFDWDVLVSADGTKGRQRLADQYLRANVEPSERYVLSVPGSSACRIKPDDTGFRNLYAVGDWTSCVLNAGCVEAAVVSGIRAANEIHRKHGNVAYAKPIVGEESP